MSDACGSNAISEQEYNLPLHVGAVFIILAVSTSACALPLLAVRFPILRIPPVALFVARHFGTGVLIATAFVHLLPTAFLSLGDPCLPKFWTEDYPAMPGAISMASVFFVAVTEMVFSRRQGLCGIPKELNACPRPAVEQVVEGSVDSDGIHPEIGPTCVTTTARTHAEPEDGQVKDTKRPERLDPDSQFWSQKKLAEDLIQKRAFLQCVLLEMGILFHSVFIGMALSVIVGKDFIILLIAIAFHQTFEGLALGSRIAGLRWKESAWKPWLMAFTYGCTTPIGQAIGLAIHNMYSPDSQTGLLMVGIMNAISSGLLIFASLVELLAEDFLSERGHLVSKHRDYEDK